MNTTVFILIASAGFYRPASLFMLLVQRKILVGEHGLVDILQFKLVSSLDMEKMQFQSYVLSKNVDINRIPELGATHGFLGNNQIRVHFLT